MEAFPSLQLNYCSLGNRLDFGPDCAGWKIDRDLHGCRAAEGSLQTGDDIRTAERDGVWEESTVRLVFSFPPVGINCPL